MANATKRKSKVPVGRRKATKKSARPKGRPNATNTEKAKVRSIVSRLDKKHTLTQGEIAFLWIALGGDPTKALTASAIAMAESSGITDNGNFCCHGIYAIYLTVNNVTMECAISPVCATRWAIKQSKNGKDFSAWTTYTGADTPNHEKTYLRFMGGDLQTQLASLPGDIGKALLDGSLGILGKGGGKLGIGGDGGVAGDAGDAIGSVGGSIGDALSSLGDPQFWLRAGKVLIGVALLLMAASALSKALTGVGATDVIPQTKIAKLASKG